MIYVTGDLHGDIDRFSGKGFRKLRKNDTLIVCGDFGFLWDGSKKEQRQLSWIGRRKYNVLFVEGTHDNLDLLEQYPVGRWNGGNVREISGRLRYLCRGEIFKVEDSSIFAFGGGESKDADSRPDSWWSSELPTQEEIASGKRNLEAHGGQVDYIVSHQCSRRLKEFLNMYDHEANVLDTFFDDIRAGYKFKRWFFGSYHINKVIPPNQIALYDAVVPIISDKL